MSEKRSALPRDCEGAETIAAATGSAEEGWRKQRSGVTRCGVSHRLRDGAVAHGGCGPARGRSGCHQLLLALALGRWLDRATCASDRRDGAAIEIVNVASGLQLAGVVDKGGLI